MMDSIRPNAQTPTPHRVAPAAAGHMTLSIYTLARIRTHMDSESDDFFRQNAGGRIESIAHVR